MREIITPIYDEAVRNLEIGETITITGKIYCGRDAVLPKICRLIEENKLDEYGIDLHGSVIFHTAVSIAGVGPTSSNKVEIEDSIELLSKSGVKIHIGKGILSDNTIKKMSKNNSVYAVMPPITALLKENTISSRVVAFPELGMEAFYELQVKNYPAVIAIAQNESIFS